MAFRPADAVGGVETSVRSVADDLRRAGYDVEVLLIGDRPGQTPRIFEGMPWRLVDGPRALWDALGDVDVLHVHSSTIRAWSPLALLVARLRRRRVVVTLHLPSSPPWSSRLRGRVRLKAQLLARGTVLAGASHAVLAPSDKASRTAADRYRPLPLRVHTAWYGVADPGPPEPLPADGPLRLLFLGRFDHHKRPEELIEAVALARREGADVRARLVGEGQLQADLEAARTRLGVEDAVELLPFTPDPAPEFARSDVLVLTSLAEGFPMVTIEAASHGRPVLVIEDLDGMRDGLSGSAVFADDETPQAFARRMVELERDRARLIELGRRARERFEEHLSSQAAAERLLSHYRNGRSG